MPNKAFEYTRYKAAGGTLRLTARAPQFNR